MNAPLLALLALLATLAAAIGSMRLWWLHAPALESNYLLDYCRFTVGMPSYAIWPYRIEVVQNLSPAVLPDAVYDGRALYLVILWPLVATAVVGMITFGIALMLSSGSQRQQDKVIRGPRLVSAWQFNLRTLFKRKGAFHIETR